MPARRESFLKSLKGLDVLGVVARPGRQLAEPHRLQFPAHRRFVHRDPEFLKYPLRQILEPPAYHPVDCRDRTTRHCRRQRLPLRRIQLRRLPRGLAVNQAIGTRRVEMENPVTDELQPHPTKLRRPTAAAAVVDRRQRKKSPRLIGVPRLSRKGSKAGTFIIGTKGYCRCYGKPPTVCHSDSYSALPGNPPCESSSMQLGISPAPILVDCI